MHISKSEAGRIRLRATDEGVLATGDGADGRCERSWSDFAGGVAISPIDRRYSGAQPRREILPTSTSSLYATLLKASTMAFASFSTRSPLRAARNRLSNRDCGEGCCPCPVAYGCRGRDITERGLFRPGTVWAHSSHMMRQRTSPPIQTKWAPTVSLRKVPTARVSTCPRFDRSHPEVPPDKRFCGHVPNQTTPQRARKPSDENRPLLPGRVKRRFESKG